MVHLFKKKIKCVEVESLMTIEGITAKIKEDYVGSKDDCKAFVHMKAMEFYEMIGKQSDGVILMPRFFNKAEHVLNYSLISRKGDSHVTFTFKEIGA